MGGPMATAAACVTHGAVSVVDINARRALAPLPRRGAQAITPPSPARRIAAGVQAQRGRRDSSAPRDGEPARPKSITTRPRSASPEYTVDGPRRGRARSSRNCTRANYAGGHPRVRWPDRRVHQPVSRIAPSRPSRNPAAQPAPGDDRPLRRRSRIE
jgi:hypothetical protein